MASFQENVDEIIELFSKYPSANERYKLVMSLGNKLPPFDNNFKKKKNI